MADDGGRGRRFVLEPIELAEDTWLLTQLLSSPTGMQPLPVSSMVIAGAQPILVDTGTAVGGTERLAKLATLVDLASVRWLFLSHEDADHAGNLGHLLARCPQAALVTSWLTVRRLAATLSVPLDRCRWVDDGDSLDAGDRVLTTITPPLYDAPSTRGLFDRRTGVYWAADAFGSSTQHWCGEAAGLGKAEWRDAFFAYHGMLAPWHEVTDARRFAARVHRLRRLGVTAIASAHGPVIRGLHVETAFDLMLQLPGRHRAPLPSGTPLEDAARG
jgi:flavorubredoxin